MENNLEVYNKNGLLIFSSHKKWLNPLFDLDIFLKNIHFSTEGLMVKDKVVGKAAAALIIKMKIKEVQTLCATKGALDLLEKYKTLCKYDELVDSITCKLEEPLKNESDIDEIYKIILERTGYDEYSFA